MQNSSPSAAASASPTTTATPSLLCCCCCLALKCNRAESKLLFALTCTTVSVARSRCAADCDRLADCAAECAGWSLAQWLRRFSCFRASDAYGSFFVRSALFLSLRNKKKQIQASYACVVRVEWEVLKYLCKIVKYSKNKNQTYDECMKLKLKTQ